MSFLMIVVVLDLRDIFNFFFDGVDVGTYGKKAIVTTIFLTNSRLRISLVLVLLTSLALIDRRLLVLATRCINGKSVGELSLSGVFLLFFCGPIPPRILRVHLADIGN